MDLVGTVIDNKYEVIQLIGEGGMGVVYEVKHTLIGRRLAMKFLHKQYVTSEEVTTRFHREAQAAAQIGHDNIIEVTDMGTTEDGSPYIVMEYLDGEDLKGILEKEVQIAPERAANILSQVLSALAGAHNVNIIHRDMKPENIYLVNKSENPDFVKLLDFGISKFRALEGEGKGLTQTGTVLGTPYYMSPEQARGDHNIGHAADIYAVGVIMFQMLTGELPFDAPNYNALLIKILTEQPPDPREIAPDMPEDLAKVILKAMNREPVGRFHTCMEFRDALTPYRSITGSSSNITQTQALRALAMKDVEAGSGKVLSETSTPLDWEQSDAPGESKPRSRVGLIAAVAAVLVVLVGGGLFLFAGSGEEKEKAASVPVSAAKPPAAEKSGAEKKPADDGEKAVKPEQAPEKKDIKTVAPSAAAVKLSAKASPPYAKIKLDGALLPSNPFDGNFPKDKLSHHVSISAPGYQDEERIVVFDKDRAIDVTLRKRVIQKRAETRKKKSSDKKKVTTKEEKRKPAKKKSIVKVKPPPTKTRASKKDSRLIDNVDPW